MRSLLYLAPAVLCASCFDNLVDLGELAKDPPEKQRYLLDVTFPEASQVTFATSPILLVQNAHGVAPYNSRPLVTRTGKSDYAQDYFHEFLVSPGQQLTQVTRRWLDMTRPFAQVIDSDSPLIPDAALELDLVHLYGDYREANAPTARIAVRASLAMIEAGSERPRVAFQREFAAEHRLADTNPGTLVDGMARALEKVLAKIQSDLAPFGASKK